MPWENLGAIRDAGGWVVAVVVLGVMVEGFRRGWWVPGYIYKREIERGDHGEDAVEESTRTTKQAADATRSATETALAVAGQLADLQRAVSHLHHAGELDRKANDVDLGSPRRRKGAAGKASGRNRS